MSLSPSTEGISFVEAVCVRPKMYTLNGTFEEVLCFLEGFYSGMLSHNTDRRRDNVALREWYGFFHWFQHAERADEQINYVVFYRKVLEIQRITDKEPIQHLRDLYQQYRQQMSKTE